MAISVYLNFRGNCREAATFYGEVFDSTPHLMTFGEAPADPAFPLTEEMRALVMHAQIEVCGSVLMMSDLLPSMAFIPGNNIALTLQGDDRAQLTAWFERLAEGGEIIMPLAETFWSPLYGNVTDRFGIGWQINCS